MNEHLTDGQLRAALDEELQPAAQSHLASCESCRRRLETVRSQTAEIRQALAFLSSSVPGRAPAVQPSLRHFYDRKLPQKETYMLKRLFGSTAVRALTVLALVLVVILAIPSARALADQILNLFRVQQVTVISVDATGLEQLTGSSTLGKQVSALVSSSVTETQDPGKPVVVADAAAASQQAGFNVRLPGNLSPSRLSVMGASAFNFTIDRSKAQSLMDEAGRSDLVLPQSIDGAVINISIPASVRADYGTCPDPSAADTNQRGSMSRQFPDCIIMSEMPSPTVNAPANVDVAQLAQIGLQFTGMSSDEAAAFTNSVDWTSTLVIPIPKNAATYKQVTVDGVTGTLIQRPVDDAPQYVLIWVKNGIIYAIGGLGANSPQALDMANSLP